ncbi:unnamed protein product, partial [Staurois parvus]
MHSTSCKTAHSTQLTLLSPQMLTPSCPVISTVSVLFISTDHCISVSLRCQWQLGI